MLTSYAQNFEDVMLWRALKHVSNGYYIDIGAQDPSIDSVSLAFYEHGWRGVHVEPTPAYAAKLREARPDEEVLELAIGTGQGLASFFSFAGTGLSTGREDIARYHIDTGLSAIEISVPLLSLAELFARYANRDVHWLKIDVEGMEAEVVASWGDSQVRPWVLCIESTMPRRQEPEHSGWEPAVFDRGYTFVHFDGLNRFYVHEDHLDLAAAFASGPNIFDDFVVAPASIYARQLMQRIAEHTATLADRDAQLATANAEVARLHQHIAATDAADAQERLAVSERAAELELILQAKDAEIERQRLHVAKLETSLAEERGALVAMVAALERASAAEGELRHVRNELDRAGEQVAALHGSTSWRATAAMRSTARGVRQIMGVPKAGVRLVMERGLAWLKQRPQMARLALRAAEFAPPLKRRLLAFAEARRLGVVASPTWTLVADPQSVQAWRELLAQEK